MEGAVIQELAERLAEPQEIGEGFIARPKDWAIVDPKSLIHPGPSADKLIVYSLGAIRDYLAANRDALDLAKLVIHVVSPQVVRLLGPIQERARNREIYVEASASNLMDNFAGRAMSIEEFVVGLQTRFVSSDDARAVLKLFGTVKHEGVKTLADDGVTQTVTAKAGVVLANEVPVPNPVTLSPYRTFREVEQPSSPFVLRVSGATTGALSATLHEGDGGAWRIAAAEAIARWLRVELGALDVKVLA